MKVADDRHLHIHLRQPLLDARHGGGGLGAVDGDAHQFGTRARQRGNLARGALGVRRVGIGHRLHDDRRSPADGNAADIHRDRFMTCLRAHIAILTAPECQTNIARSTRSVHQNQTAGHQGDGGRKCGGQGIAEHQMAAGDAEQGREK